MRLNAPDARGWKFTEKAEIVAGHFALAVWDTLWTLAWRVSGKRIRVIDHEWAWTLFLNLAAAAWLWDDLRRGDMPEHLRIGGVWT